MSNPYAPPSADHAQPTPGDRPGEAPKAPSKKPNPSPTPRPVPEPPDPEQVLAAGRLVRRLGVWLLAAAVVDLLPFPWSAASLVFIVGAIVTGVRAIRATSKARIGGGLSFMAVVGLALAGLLGLTTLATLALWPAQWALQDCLGSAVTESATASCQQDFEQRSTDLLEDWLGSADS